MSYRPDRDRKLALFRLYCPAPLDIKRSSVSYFRSEHHIIGMRTHPHAEASYRVTPLASGTFGVEVAIPGTCPTTVSSFATEAAAQAWIARDKSRVQSESQTGKWFQKTRQGVRREASQGLEPTRMS